MPFRFTSGDVAYIVENHLRVQKVVVMRVYGGFATFRFKERSGGASLRLTRLFPTHQAAEASLNAAQMPSSSLLN